MVTAWLSDRVCLSRDSLAEACTPELKGLARVMQLGLKLALEAIYIMCIWQQFTMQASTYICVQY